METLTRALPALIVLILVIGGAGLYRWLASPATATPVQRSSTVTADGRPTLIELGSNTCASCLAMQRVLDELATTHGDSLQLVSIDLREQPEQAAAWKVIAIPTQVLLDGTGREIGRHIGFISASALRERFAAAGFPLTPSSPDGS